MLLISADRYPRIGEKRSWHDRKAETAQGLSTRLDIQHYKATQLRTEKHKIWSQEKINRVNELIIGNGGREENQ